MPQSYPTKKQLDDMKKKKTEEGPSLVDQLKHTVDVFNEWSGSDYANAAGEAAKRNREFEEKKLKKK
jgi:hypothetical protein